MDNNQSMYDRERWCCEQCRRRCNGNFHTIKAGETLYSISRMYNVPVAEIMRANPYVNVYNLRINDRICIPNMMMQPMPYPEMPDDYFEMNGGMNNGMMPGGNMNNNMGMQPVMPMPRDNMNMPERVDSMSNNSFNEYDSVGDMLKKTGLTMDELLSRLN